MIVVFTIGYTDNTISFMICKSLLNYAFALCSWPLWGYAIICIFVNIHGKFFNAVN